MSTGADAIGCQVEDALITDELRTRPARPPDHARENRALVSLTEMLTRDPATVLQRTAELALELCGAESAGISILERGGANGLLRWHALVGALAPHLHGTMPREASPCGTVLDRQEVLLFNEAAERCYPAMRGLEPRIYEILLVPWEVEGVVTGTLWAIMHSPDRRFESEDARLLANLTRYAAAGWTLQEGRRAAEVRAAGEEALRAGEERLRVANAALQQRLAKLESANQKNQDARSAALNLMQDALAAREEAEQMSVTLRASEERLRSALSISTVGVLFWRETSVLSEVNEAFLSMTGFTREEVLGKTWRDLTPVEFHDVSLAANQELLTRGESTPFEKQYLRKDGSRCWVLSTARKVGGEAAEFAIDLTDRKAAENAVRESERRLRLLADAVPQIIWANSADGTANYFNQRWYEYSGLSFEESLGLGWEVIVHPDDAPHSVPAWREALAAGDVFDTEYRLRCADGQYRWFIGRNVPIRNAGGQVTGWFGTATDVHELKETEAALRASEEQFRRAIEEAPIPVIMHAEDGQVLQISRTWTKLTGYAPADMPDFGAWLTEAYGVGADAVREHVHQLFTGEVQQLEAEIDVATRDGSTRCWAFSASAPGTLRDGRRFIVGMALDVTDRRVAERAAQESEERVRIAVESARMGTWDWDLPEHQVTWNDRHFQLLGMPPRPNPIPESAFFNHVHPEDRDELTRHIRQSVAERGAFEATFRIVTDQDEERWMNGYGRVTRAREGEPVQMSGVMIDITDRRRGEMALRESEERLRLAQEAGEVGIWDWDTVTGCGYWSETLWRLFGHATPLTSERDAWREQVEPEDRRRVVENIRRLLDSGADEFRDWFRIRRPDGELRWIESVARITREPSGRAVRMMGVNIDVTERKRSEAALSASEERLRLVLENAREYAIFSLDLERTILSWNIGAEAILGYRREEAIGQFGDIIFTTEDRVARAPENEAATAIAEDRAADERWHVRKDGSTFWGSGVMMAMRNAEGTVVGLVKIFRDETKARSAKEALEQSRAELWTALQENERARAEVEAAGRAKDHFLAVLSHELRTPLMPVLLGVRTLGRIKDLPAAARETLQMIQRNVELESHFIDDLLDVTRATRGKLEIEHEPVDLHRVVKDALEVAAHDLEAKKQVLAVSLEATARELSGDARRLQQAIWNLLKNASKFTPEGGEIRLRTRNELDCVVVEVSDSGIGFEPSAAERIFDAFAQASEEITRLFGGLGLGLSIAKATVAAHQGQIRAESLGKGRGATFVITLPLAPPSGISHPGTATC